MRKRAKSQKAIELHLQARGYEQVHEGYFAKGSVHVSFTRWDSDRMGWHYHWTEVARGGTYSKSFPIMRSFYRLDRTLDRFEAMTDTPLGALSWPGHGNVLKRGESPVKSS